MEETKFIIKIDCPDKIGIVAQITRTLAEKNINIVDLQEYVDTKHNYFFARIMCKTTQASSSIEQLEQEYRTQLQSLVHKDSNVSLHKLTKKKLIIMATKEYHCLGEILLRTKYDTFDAEILCVIANREENIKDLCENMKVPFYYIPAGDNRNAHEQELLNCTKQYNPDYIVLARYMRILSEKFISNYHHKIINIHHSFLPAFIGANPYRQAFERGVKIIGATAHYVTKDLDEGPIISQQVKSVDHSFTVKSLQKTGRDTEKITLIDALEKVIHDRVFIFNNKTIVF